MDTCKITTLDRSMSSNVKKRRFYPDSFPEFDFEPTRDRFDIVRTSDFADGLVARVDIGSGEVVFRFTGVMINKLTLYTLQYTEGCHIHDPYVMGKVLHSCNPNMHCDMRTLTFTAVRDIKPGDFLTMDYETTEDQLFRPFECRCGSPMCRGWIRGSAIPAVVPVGFTI